MSSLRLLSFAVLLLSLVGCDTTGDQIQLTEPSAESFALAYVPNDGIAHAPLSGTTRYEVFEANATPGANTKIAQATLRTVSPSRPLMTLTVYSMAGTTNFPPPGRYEFAQTSERPILAQLTVGGRSYSPYRGVITIEEASGAALRVRIDAEMTTGGCALMPSTVCSGPTLTGRLVANVRAGADG